MRTSISLLLVSALAWLAAVPSASAQQQVAGSLRVGLAELGSLPAGATLTDATTLVLDLAAAKALARRRSPIMTAASAGVANVRAKLAEGHSAWFPTIEATAFATVIPTKKVGASGADWMEDWDWTQPKPLMTGQISFTQTLYTFGKLDALSQMARHGVEIAEATRRIVEAELDYQVERAWWGLVMAADLDEVVTKGRAQIEKERDRLEWMRDDGDEKFEPADLVKLRVVEVEFEDKVRAAMRARSLAQDALRFALNLDAPWTIQPSLREMAPPELEPLPVAAYETVAVANHPRELARRGGLLLRIDQLRYERNKLLPDVVLTGRLATTYAPGTQQTNDSLADNPTNPTQSGAGVAIRWRVDLFRQFDRIEQTAATMRQERSRNQLERQKMRVDVRNSVREMIDLKEMSVFHDRALRATRGQMVAATDMAEKGLGSRAAAVTAIEQYVRRRLAHADNLYRYHVAVAELSRAIGVDVRSMPAPTRASAPAATDEGDAP